MRYNAPVPKVLVIDDTSELLLAVKTFLSQSGFSVVTAADGLDGRLLAKDSKPDIVLVDADLPGLDGHGVCRSLKADPETKTLPVIIMSGRLVDEGSVVSGLEGGADDYILKPFRMKVLLARLRAVLRRSAGAAAPAARGAGRLALDSEGRTVKVDGKPVKLTRKEFDLLALLIEKPGRVITSSFLLESVWGYDLTQYNDTHTVETHVSRLRKKLGIPCIENVPGIGYKYAVEEDAAKH